MFFKLEVQMAEHGLEGNSQARSSHAFTYLGTGVDFREIKLHLLCKVHFKKTFFFLNLFFFLSSVVILIA